MDPRNSFIFNWLPLRLLLQNSKLKNMNNNKGFEKFIKPEFKGAKKKESIRQDKRKAKAESRAIGEDPVRTTVNCVPTMFVPEL